MQGTLDDREFGGAVAKISFPLVPTKQSTEPSEASESPADSLSVPAPDWRPQNG